MPTPCSLSFHRFSLLLTAALLALHGITQSSFVGPNVDLLVGLRVTPVTKDAALQQYPYRAFIESLSNNTSPIVGQQIPYSELHGDTMRCISAKDWPDPKYSSHYKLLTLVREHGDTIYYAHSVQFHFNNELQYVDSIQIPPVNYCTDITYRLDRFTDTQEWRTPLLDHLTYIKTIEHGITKYSAYLSTVSFIPDSGNGVILLLQSGRRIPFDTPVSITLNHEAQFEASASFYLTKEQVSTLISDPVVAFRLDIHDQDITNPHKYSQMLKCLFTLSK